MRESASAGGTMLAAGLLAAVVLVLLSRLRLPRAARTRRQAERDFHKVRQTLLAARETAGVGVWVWNFKAHGESMWSPEVYWLFGRAPADGPLSPEQWRAAVHPEDRERAEAVVAGALAGGTAYQDEYRIMRPDGEVRWLLTRGRVVAKGPTAAMMAGIVLDVTSHHIAVAALDEDRRLRTRRAVEDREQQLHAILDQMPIGVAIAKVPSGELLFHNAKAVELLRHPLLAAAGIGDYGRYGARHADGTPYRPEEYPIARAALSGARIDREKMLYRRGDGTMALFDVSAAPIRDDRGNPVFAVATFEDVSERQAAQRALQDSERRLQQLADAMPQLVWSANASGVVDFYNRRASEYAGLARQDDGTWLWAPVIHPDDIKETIAAWRTAVATGEPYELEHRVARADGGFRWHISRALPMRDGDGKVVRWYGTATDVHDLKMAEWTAEQASVAKSRFLAAASHDLRQPAQSLMLLTSALAGRLTDEGALGLVRHIERATAALKNLLDGLLDISRLDAHVVETEEKNFPLAGLLHSLAAEYALRAAEKGLELRLVPTRLWLRSDPALLERILRNLVENALKYTVEGRILVGARRRGDAVRIEVRDTGIGIPAVHHEAIFQEFHQIGNPERDRTKGLGLGLAIVRRLADLLGYQVTLRSVPDRGACFAVTVPAAAPDPAAQEPQTGPVAGDGGRRGLVAVIDDEEDVQAALKLQLEAWGYRVAAGSDDGQVLARLGGHVPDIVLADYRLRSGLTGLAAIARLEQAAGRPLPGAILTGDTAADNIAEAKRGGRMLLHKPLAAAELWDCLASLSPVSDEPPARRQGMRG